MKTSTVIKNALLGCLLVMTAQVQASLQVGDAAPDWTLEASDGKTYRLSELRGKHVVLAFFPKAFTGGCTIECKSVRDSKRQVRPFDVQFFMASTDDLDTNKAFAEQNDANFPILSDAGKGVSKAYGVLASMGYSKRWTFYIDAQGKIVKIDKDVNPSTAGQDLLKNLVALNVPTKG
jgi:peroxiredoxin Q/BCP